MNEIEEDMEKYKVLVPLVYDLERQELYEAKHDEYKYAVYLKSEADRYIAHLKMKRCYRMAYWCACRSIAFLDENFAKSEWYDKWKFAWRKLAEHYKEMAK